MSYPSIPFHVPAFVLTAVLLFANLPVMAQGDSKKGAAKVEFRVTRFDPDDRKSPVFRAGGADRQVEIEVPLTFIAGPFEAPLRDGTTLDLWQGTAEKPVISLEIKPEEREHLLLVFFQQDETFRVLKVHSPPSRIKGGDRFIINATPNEMAIKLGKAEPLMIPASKSGVLAGPRGSGIVSLPVLISLKQQDEWELASTEQWPCDPRFRKYLVAYISPRSRHLVFHSVTERM
jgi:hypothetical protein